MRSGSPLRLDDKPGGGVQLNPGRDERQRLNDDEIVVLTTYR